MYLKQLDIVGFKSFADKTKLTFDPGLIAIVGPNGCGKSNVSDAIRWVLGEQRPTALRCSKLVDVVFNGTDTRKPLGLAEVTITFADCEKELGTDYHEVTIQRRVYRDGSGEYFLNKQPCRLRDIQHLLMGTGIGTSSYSVMAQGQIDAILSSKPEDRRGVFEEAAGITKFKADRKEALRKIEQTEQNLLREADVLKEMKRQIGSLQRQVGKATSTSRSKRSIPSTRSSSRTPPTGATSTSPSKRRLVPWPRRSAASRSCMPRCTSSRSASSRSRRARRRRTTPTAAPTRRARRARDSRREGAARGDRHAGRIPRPEDAPSH